jgi:sulfite reductase beta subunit-like hemoprotein
VDTAEYRGPGFHFYIGGGYGREGRIAVAARRAVPCPEVPAETARILEIYLGKRRPGESFTAFAGRHTGAELQSLFGGSDGSAEAAPAAATLAGKEA